MTIHVEAVADGARNLEVASFGDPALAWREIRSVQSSEPPIVGHLAPREIRTVTRRALRHRPDDVLAMGSSLVVVQHGDWRFGRLEAPRESTFRRDIDRPTECDRQGDRPDRDAAEPAPHAGGAAPRAGVVEIIAITSC